MSLSGSPPPCRSHRTIRVVSRWSDRYERGDRVGVWTEMTSLGEGLGSEDRQEASRVARRTMRRARRNIERLVELLPSVGYVFDMRDGQAVFEPPSLTITEELDHLEGEVGVLPISLRCWYEEVGRVNLVGHHPGWNFEYHDPIVVDAPVDFVLAEYGAWQEGRGTERGQGGFTIAVAPDFLHKANYSGGPPYELEVPNSGVDGPLRWERHQTTFVNYLRIAFRWAGCPGWDRDVLDERQAPSVLVPAVLGEVAAELLPI